MRRIPQLIPCKYQDVRRPAGDHFIDVSLRVQWVQNWFVTTRLSKPNLESFYHHRSDPKFSPFSTNYRSHNKAPSFAHPLVFKFSLNLITNNIQTIPCKSCQEKQSACYIAPEATRHLLIFLRFTSTRVRLNKKVFFFAISGLGLLNPHIPALVEFNFVYAAL